MQRQGKAAPPRQYLAPRTYGDHSPFRAVPVEARRGLLVFEGVGTDSVECTVHTHEIE